MAILNDPILKNLAEYIDNHGGVLFIGPCLSCYGATDELISDKFSEKIAEDFGLDVRNDPDNSGPGYILQNALTIPLKERSARLATIKANYKDFFNKHFRKKHIHSLIAKLNFRLIINTNPDEEVFSRMEGKKLFSFYDSSNNSRLKSGAQPAKGETAPDNADLNDFSFDNGTRVVYNIFGSFRSPNSVRLCESDFIDLIRDIDTENGIPRVIRNYIGSHVPLVFIGFSYNDWYLKVLFKVLELDKARETIPPEAVTYRMSIHSNLWPTPAGVIKLFYESEFNFMFRNHLTEDYIRTLIHYTPGRKEDAEDDAIRPLKAVIIFNYDSEEDKKLKDLFVKQLSFLKGRYIEDIWSSDMADGGQVRGNEEEIKISQAEIAIFLLSPDFHDKAKNCGSYLTALRNEEDVLIVPIMARKYIYENDPALQDLEILPVVNGNVSPLGSIREGLDDVVVEICKSIQAKIKEQREL